MRRDERGGAVSLWVLLMVPVSAFAAVVAMAGPQRLAAESSVQDAAGDLAALAVAWRDGQGTAGGPLLAFFGDCEMLTDELRSERNALGDAIRALPDEAAPGEEEFDRLAGGVRAALGRLNLAPPAALDSQRELAYQFGRLYGAEGHVASWEAACRAVTDALVRDLGNLGIDLDSLSGFYSDSLTGSGDWPSQGCFSADGVLLAGHTARASCTAAGGEWLARPCRTAADVAVRDAVHVALAADWRYAGWAATQVWPDGISMGAEAVGRLAQRVETPPEGSPASPPAASCGHRLVVLDEVGRPVWARSDPPPPRPTARELSQSVRRTPFSG
ncbi:hypothetical protein [Candidatus Poriferisodalis sp.]|uniref:hypothetical protein n=1 Tax=Candidatus Poriferisodalis sp. TaxID=3101277 RepID=UPI003B01D08E